MRFNNLYLYFLPLPNQLVPLTVTANTYPYARTKDSSYLVLVVDTRSLGVGIPRTTSPPRVNVPAAALMKTGILFDLL